MSDRPNPLLQIGGGDPSNPLIQNAPTWADAYRWHAQNLADTWAALKNPQMWLDAAKQYSNALLMGSTAPGVRAFHGSPYDFERFDIGKIGSGEGAQVKGHGLYFAEHEPVAQTYRDKLGGNITYQGEKTRSYPVANLPPDQQAIHNVTQGMWELASREGVPGDPAAAIAAERQRALADAAYHQTQGSARDADYAGEVAAQIDRLKPEDFAFDRGHMYEVNIGAEREHMLDWDKTVGQHPDAVRDKLLDMGYGDRQRGAEVYAHLASGPGGDVGASQQLQDAGIPGIRYLDQGSRAGGQGTSNYVVFNDNIIDILRKYGIAGLIGGGAAAVADNDGDGAAPPVAQ